jgi:hypothetical protein
MSLYCFWHLVLAATSAANKAWLISAWCRCGDGGQSFTRPITRSITPWTTSAGRLRAGGQRSSGACSTLFLIGLHSCCVVLTASPSQSPHDMALTNSHPHRHGPTLDAQNTPQLYGRKRSGHTELITHMNGD